MSLNLSNQSDTQPQTTPDSSGVSGITLRSILIGSVLAILLNYLDVYATTMIRGAYLSLNFSTPAALFFFFFLALGSALVALIRRPLALTQDEQIAIYVMLVIACCIPGMGFTQFMVPCLVGSTYYATPENNWDELYNQHIPTWMMPQGDDAVRFFFEGRDVSCKQYQGWRIQGHNRWWDGEYDQCSEIRKAKWRRERVGLFDGS